MCTVRKAEGDGTESKGKVVDSSNDIGHLVLTYEIK